MKSMYQFALATLLLCLSATQALKSQDLSLIAPYTHQTYYEVISDEAGNQVVHTECDEPDNFVHFTYNKELGTCHFNLDETVFKVTSITKGANDEEFLIKYLDEFKEPATAIFFYDRVVNNLFFTFDGNEMAFIGQDELEKVKVIDECGK